MMKRLIVLAIGLSFLPLGFVGCADKSTSKVETKVSTPDGETTRTTETTVKKTGDNPPPAR
jgi:hypothetical protein